MEKFEVVSDYGCGYFTNKQDAILCLQMLGSYHDMAINRTEVMEALDKTGFYEKWPLNIRRYFDE